MSAKVDAAVRRALEIMKSDAVIITAAEIRHGVLEQAQLYFWSDGSPVMDVVSKDDLVQNWPDAGVYVLSGTAGSGDPFKAVTMFEGAEDMYFRIDGTRTESDDLGPLPSVLFMETVEKISLGG